MKFLRIYFLIGLFALLSCSESAYSEQQENGLFTEKEPQEKTERSISDFSPVDSLNLTEEFEGVSVFGLKLYGDNIYVKVDGNNFLVLDKQDFSLVNEITIPEGRGPGEILVVRDFDVANDYLVILDGNAQKTALYDLEGNFIEEFLNDQYRPEAIEMVDENTFYYKAAPRNPYLFYEADREHNIGHRFQEQSNDLHILAYTGEMVYQDSSIYFGGYSEPLLRRYEITDNGVTPGFSKAVIDDYNAENNYREAEAETSDGSFRLSGYTDEAKYASTDIAVDDNYLYSVRHSNSEEDYKFLDIYSAEDGNYLGSIPMRYNSAYISLGEKHIYTVEVESGDPVQRHLMKYQKLQFYF